MTKTINNCLNNKRNQNYDIKIYFVGIMPRCAFKIEYDGSPSYEKAYLELIFIIFNLLCIDLFLSLIYWTFVITYKIAKLVRVNKNADQTYKPYPPIIKIFKFIIFLIPFFSF